MYAFREDRSRKLLLVELTRRITTDEALRAISQAFTLVEASGLQAVRCDLTGLRRAPGSLLMLATSFAVRYRPGLRVAFLGTTAQLPLIERLIRFSGVREGLRAFDSPIDADVWLSAAGEPPRRLLPVARRHPRQLVGSAATSAPPVAVASKGRRR